LIKKIFVAVFDHRD